MQALCAAYYPLFAASCPGGRMPRIAVRDMNTRWGSCSLRTGTLAFARRLCAMPPPAQEYVVVHEFCHFAHPDHSPAFWAAVAAVLCPTTAPAARCCAAGGEPALAPSSRCRPREAPDV